MKKKYLIFAATGSIGSSLANQLYNEKRDCHLIGRNEEELKKLANKLNYSFSVCDVLKIDFTTSHTWLKMLKPKGKKLVFSPLMMMHGLM